MEEKKQNQLLKKIVSVLELPDSAYEKAIKRYDDLTDWFVRPESTCKDNDPHIFPQGSFLLGTAIRPLDEKEEYDLDLACKLRAGISKATHTQYQLKSQVGAEIESYRTVRGIEQEKEEKRRCWRLEYKDNLKFHMDIVPCIPEAKEKRDLIFESLKKQLGADITLASDIIKYSVSITDTEKQEYFSLSDDWELSNPEGYGIWFKNRMRTIPLTIKLSEAKIDSIPLYKRKTHLQRCVQLLKRHRDQWAKGNEESKPISIIITTLAAHAYQGESDLRGALFGILERMGNYVNSQTPRVSNPTNPAEDFADKWYSVEGIKLRLEENFWKWLKQAKADFNSITFQNDPETIQLLIEEKMSLKISKNETCLILGNAPNVLVKSKPTNLNAEEHAKPWLRH